jgi:hypothetical protein
MNFRHAPGALIALVLAFSGVPCPGQAPSPAPKPVLAIDVVESLGRGTNRLTDFDRISTVFTDVFSRRKWPVTLKMERFAANDPSYDYELRVFFEGIYEETPGDLTFHAWMTLFDHGTKHDFGMVRFRYYPRPGQDAEDALERAVRGGAEEVAPKIGAILITHGDGHKN